MQEYRSIFHEHSHVVGIFKLPGYAQIPSDEVLCSWIQELMLLAVLAASSQRFPWRPYQFALAVTFCYLSF